MSVADVRDWLGVAATAAAAALEQRRSDYTLDTLRRLHEVVGRSLNFRASGVQLEIDGLLLACPLRLPLARAALRKAPTATERETFLGVAVKYRGDLQWPYFEVAVALDEIALEMRKILDPEGHAEVSFECLAHP